MNSLVHSRVVIELTSNEAADEYKARQIEAAGAANPFSSVKAFVRILNGAQAGGI